MENLLNFFIFSKATVLDVTLYTILIPANREIWRFVKERSLGLFRGSTLNGWKAKRTMDVAEFFRRHSSKSSKIYLRSITVREWRPDSRPPKNSEIHRVRLKFLKIFLVYVNFG